MMNHHSLAVCVCVGGGGGGVQSFIYLKEVHHIFLSIKTNTLSIKYFGYCKEQTNLTKTGKAQDWTRIDDYATI